MHLRSTRTRTGCRLALVRLLGAAAALALAGCASPTTASVREIVANEKALNETGISDLTGVKVDFSAMILCCGPFDRGSRWEREHRECQPCSGEISPEGASERGWNGKVRHRPTMSGRTVHTAAESTV